MTDFILSPGITPALVGAWSVVLPLSLGLAYVFYRGRGLEVTIGLNAVGLATIKVYTDYADIFDLLLAVIILVAGLAWLALSLSPYAARTRLTLRASAVLALLAVPLGGVKVISDFYDPFDIFLGCLGILAGALLLRWVLSGSPSLPRSRRSTLIFVGASMAVLLALLLATWQQVIPAWLMLALSPYVPISVLAYGR